MENPVEDISRVFHNLLICPKKSLIEKEFKRYFTSDLEFKHFLANIHSRAGSREDVIGIFRFYRGMGGKLNE